MKAINLPQKQAGQASSEVNIRFLNLRHDTAARGLFSLIERLLVHEYGAGVPV